MDELHIVTHVPFLSAVDAYAQVVCNFHWINGIYLTQWQKVSAENSENPQCICTAVYTSHAARPTRTGVGHEAQRLAILGPAIPTSAIPPITAPPPPLFQTFPLQGNALRMQSSMHQNASIVRKSLTDKGHVGPVIAPYKRRKTSNRPFPMAGPSASIQEPEPELRQVIIILYPQCLAMTKKQPSVERTIMSTFIKAMETAKLTLTYTYQSDQEHDPDHFATQFKKELRYHMIRNDLLSPDRVPPLDSNTHLNNWVPVEIKLAHSVYKFKMTNEKAVHQWTIGHLIAQAKALRPIVDNTPPFACLAPAFGNITRSHWHPEGCEKDEAFVHACYSKHILAPFQQHGPASDTITCTEACHPIIDPLDSDSSSDVSDLDISLALAERKRRAPDPPVTDRHRTTPIPPSQHLPPPPRPFPVSPPRQCAPFTHPPSRHHHVPMRSDDRPIATCAPGTVAQPLEISDEEDGVPPTTGIKTGMQSIRPSIITFEDFLNAIQDAQAQNPFEFTILGTGIEAIAALLWRIMLKPEHFKDHDNNEEEHQPSGTNARVGKLPTFSHVLTGIQTWGLTGLGGTVGAVIGRQAITRCIDHVIKEHPTDWYNYQGVYNLILPTNALGQAVTLSQFTGYGRLIAVAFAWGIGTPAISPYLILYLMSGGNRAACTDLDFIRSISQSQADEIQAWPATLSDYKQGSLAPAAHCLRTQVDDNPTDPAMLSADQYRALTQHIKERHLYGPTWGHMDLPVVQLHLEALLAGFNQPLMPNGRGPKLVEMFPDNVDQVKRLVASLYSHDFHDVAKGKHLLVIFTPRDRGCAWSECKPSDHYVKQFKLALVRYLIRPGHPRINVRQQGNDRDVLIQTLLITEEEYNKVAKEAKPAKWRIQQFLKAITGVATLPPGNEWCLTVRLHPPMAGRKGKENQTPPAFHTCDHAMDVYLEEPLVAMLEDENLRRAGPDAKIDQWLHQSILSARNDFNTL